MEDPNEKLLDTVKFMFTYNKMTITSSSINDRNYISITLKRSLGQQDAFVLVCKAPYSGQTLYSMRYCGPSRPTLMGKILHVIQLIKLIKEAQLD